MKMVTSDDATDVFNAFDEVEATFGNTIIPQVY
jgi:tRNA-dihydrouridine synthase B